MITRFVFITLTLIGTSTRAQSAPTRAALGETLWLAREANVLADATPATAAARLPALIKQHFNLEVTCGRGQLLNPSAPRCLMGMRQVARAYYRGLLKPPTTEVSEVVQVNVTDLDYVHVSADETSLRINLPYTTTAEGAAEIITRVLTKRAVRTRIKRLAEFRQTLESWNELGLAELDFDPNLSLATKRGMIETLLRLAAEDESLFDRPTETFYVGRVFRPLFERRLRLEEALKADASIDYVRRFLREAKNDAGVAAVQARVERLRTRLRAVGEELQTKLKVKFDCSDRTYLTLASCARTLERFARFAARTGVTELDAKMILVVGTSENDRDFQVFQSIEDKEEFRIFALREEFDFADLHRFARDRGWSL